MSSRKTKLKQKLSNFFHEKVESKDLLHLEKIVLMVILLVFTLIALVVNKSVSYKKYDILEYFLGTWGLVSAWLLFPVDRVCPVTLF